MAKFTDWAARPGGLIIFGLIAFVCVVMAGSFTIYVNHESATTRREARERSAVAIETCQRVVAISTAQSQTDDLATIRALEDALTGVSARVSAALLAAENKILQRQAPTDACVPKESP